MRRKGAVAPDEYVQKDETYGGTQKITSSYEDRGTRSTSSSYRTPYMQRRENRCDSSYTLEGFPKDTSEAVLSLHACRDPGLSFHHNDGWRRDTVNLTP